MFTGGMAQGISAGIDSNRDWAERQQLMQIKKLAIGKAMREEEQDASDAAVLNHMGQAEQSAPINPPGLTPMPQGSPMPPWPGVSSAPPGAGGNTQMQQLPNPGGGSPPPQPMPNPGGPPAPAVNLQAGQPQIPPYRTIGQQPQPQGQPSRVDTPAITPKNDLFTFDGLKAEMDAQDIPPAQQARIVAKNLSILTFKSREQAEKVKEKLAEMHEADAQYRIQQGDRRLDQSDARQQQQHQDTMARMDQSDRHFNASLERRDRGLDQRDPKAGSGSGGGKNYLAEFMAKGEVNPTVRLSKDGVKTFNAAAQNAEENDIEFHPKEILQKISEATSKGRTAGGTQMITRKENVNQSLKLLDDMEVTGDKLNYNDNKWVAQLESWKKGVNQDSILTEYLTQRADALFKLSGALKLNGVTDKSIQVEEEANHPTLSPKALKGWLNAQRRALNQASAEMKKDFNYYDMQQVPTAEPGTGGAGPKSGGAVSTYSDADKERRYQKWKAENAEK